MQALAFDMSATNFLWQGVDDPPPGRGLHFVAFGLARLHTDIWLDAVLRIIYFSLAHVHSCFFLISNFNPKAEDL